MGEMFTSLFQKDKKPKYQKLLFLKKFGKGRIKYYFLNIIQNSLGRCWDDVDILLFSS